VTPSAPGVGQIVAFSARDTDRLRRIVAASAHAPEHTIEDSLPDRVVRRRGWPRAGRWEAVGHGQLGRERLAICFDASPRLLAAGSAPGVPGFAGGDLAEEVARSLVVGGVQPQHRAAQGLCLVVVAEPPAGEGQAMQAA